MKKQRLTEIVVDDTSDDDGGSTRIFGATEAHRGSTKMSTAQDFELSSVSGSESDAVRKTLKDGKKYRS